MISIIILRVYMNTFKFYGYVMFFSFSSGSINQWAQKHLITYFQVFFLNPITHIFFIASVKMTSCRIAMIFFLWAPKWPLAINCYPLRNKMQFSHKMNHTICVYERRAKYRQTVHANCAVQSMCKIYTKSLFEKDFTVNIIV